MRQKISGGSPYEPIIGFSRAIRDGRHIFVSGTGPVGADTADAATQASRIFDIIATALREAGAGLEHIVRTRVYLTHVEDWEEVARIHGGLFGEIRPAATIVVVAKLLNPNWRLEIEADALLPKANVLAVDPPLEIAHKRIRETEEKALRKLRTRTSTPKAS
ncbi:MAG TPA: RidA family protein [Acidobacteriaceae bacterium]|jgi:enamine deaminase RidA (YjgF/YER057c/UK114 family)|nr:RidA family protein [Acidobacteriaceae bacterium]